MDNDLGKEVCCAYHKNCPLRTVGNRSGIETGYILNVSHECYSDAILSGN
jgi:hypothetical protein